MKKTYNSNEAVITNEIVNGVVYTTINGVTTANGRIYHEGMQIEGEMKNFPEFAKGFVIEDTEAKPEAVIEEVPTMAAHKAAEAMAITEAVPEAKAEKAKAEAAPEAVHKYVSGEKFKLTNSRNIGGTLDKADKSLWGFCEKIHNEFIVNGVKSYFFREAYVAYFGDAFGYNVTKKEGREAAEKAMAAISEKALQDTWLARSMRNANKMKATFKSELPRYYNNDGVLVIAKEKTIATAASGLTMAEKAVYDEKCKGEAATHKKAAINGVWYYVKATADIETIANDMAAIRLQVRKAHAKPEALPVVWIGAKGNLLTLVRKDAFTYADMLPIITKIMYCKAVKYNYVTKNVPEAKAEKAKAEAAPEAVIEAAPEAMTEAAPEAVIEAVIETVPEVKPSFFARFFKKIG